MFFTFIRLNGALRHYLNGNVEFKIIFALAHSTNSESDLMVRYGII
jgi:hypothetical protein